MNEYYIEYDCYVLLYVFFFYIFLLNIICVYVYVNRISTTYSKYNINKDMSIAYDFIFNAYQTKKY